MDTQISLINERAFGEDDEMSQTNIHNDLIMYLIYVLRYLFSGQNTAMFTSIDLYGDPAHPSQKKSPDLLVIDNITIDPDHAIISYTIDEEHVAPRVLMEISSESNWINDLEEKHNVYERMRVPEYFVCDPQPERVWTGIWQNEPRLIGWRYNSLIGGYVRIEEEPQGLWSEQLTSYLRMDGENGRELHLYDHEGNRRLTGEEAAEQRAEQEHIQRLLAEEQAKKVEARAKDAEQQAKDAEARAKGAKQQFEQERKERQLAEDRAKDAAQQILNLQKQVEELLRKARQDDQETDSNQPK